MAHKPGHEFPEKMRRGKEAHESARELRRAMGYDAKAEKHDKRRMKKAQKRRRGY